MTGTRQTRQRAIILNTLNAAPGPLTVVELHARAQQHLPQLGIATVYRALNLLQQQGQAVLVEMPGEEPHYEPADRGHHHHFYCEECDQWFDLPHCLVPHLDGMTLREGFVVAGHDLTLRGTCPDCSGKESGTKRQ